MLAGIMAFTGGSLAQKVVHVQLAPQKIGFAPAGSKLPADGYIQLHLKGIGKGKSYSEVSGKFLRDPNHQMLAQQRQSLFIGETLRGMLLNAWGWGTLGNWARVTGIVLVAISVIVFIIPLLAASRRSSTVGARASEPAAVAEAV
jgi:hypothetical protein